MAGGGGGGESGEPEFQIAPMIDVLLVLLIFFMSITTAQILRVDPSITLPVSVNAKPADPKLSKHELAVNLRWNKATSKSFMVLEDQPFPEPEKLPDELRARMRKDPDMRVVVRGDKDLPAIEIQRVMDLIGQGGIADISFSAANK